MESRCGVAHGKNMVNGWGSNIAILDSGVEGEGELCWTFYNGQKN